MKRFSARDLWFIVLFGAIYTVNFIDRMIISVVGEPIRREFGLSDLQLGAMGGVAFALFYGGIGIPIARLAERTSRIGIVIVATALWSAMTMLSGAAVSYAHLLLARMGVGIGEAGLTPPVVSMVADRFAPEQRATAYSLMTVGVSLGAAVGALAGGWIAQVHGWRMAFLVMGAPGLVLAVLLWLTISEPPRHHAAGETPPLRAVLRRVWASRAFVSFTVGNAMVALVGFGLNLFLIPLLVRRFGFDIRTAALVFALTLSAATGLGGAFGGMLADRIASHRHRRYGLLPMASTALALPLFLAAIWQDDWRILTVLLFASSFCLYAFLPTIMTVTQRLVEPRMRATAAAIHSFGQTVFGLAAGAALLGWMSDALAARAYGAGYAHDCLVAKAAMAGPACAAASGKGLQQGLMLLGLFLLLAIVSYWFAARAIDREIIEAEQASAG